MSDSGNFVKSYPKVGYYVLPDRVRCHKIGIIFNDGTESPYIENCDSFIKSLKYLRDYDFDVQIIQGSHLAQLHDNAIAHGVEGLIWFNPPAVAAPFIQKIQDAGDILQVAIQWSAPHFVCGACCVSYDDRAIGVALVQAMLRRGHRRLIISTDFNDMTAGMFTALAEVGINGKDIIFTNVADDQEGFRAMLKKHKCTGIIANGGMLNFDAAFNVAASLPETERPEILIYNGGQTAIRAMSPKGIKFLAMNATKSMGETAAQLLTDHILHGHALTDIKFSGDDMVISEHNTHVNVKLKAQKLNAKTRT